MSINKFYFYISRTVFLFWTLIQIYNITLEKHNRFSCTVKFAIMITYEQGMKKKYWITMLFVEQTRFYILFRGVIVWKEIDIQVKPCTTVVDHQLCSIIFKHMYRTNHCGLWQRDLPSAAAETPRGNFLYSFRAIF